MKRRQELQKANPGVRMPEITTQLREEFAGVFDGLFMNPLLDMEGVFAQDRVLSVR